MGYERGGRDAGREDGDRQPRQDYDRSYGSRAYGERGDEGRYGYGRGDARPDDARREDMTWQSRQDQDRARLDRGRDAYAPRDDARRSPERDRDQGRQPQGYDYDDRGFIERAGDEVRSWFGDEDAERRRRLDDRYAAREDDRGSSRNYGSGYTGAGDHGAGRGAGADRQSSGHDSNYRSWRDRQMEQFDRDYDDYRREHQSKFDSDFHGWRTGRQTQRDALGRVREHQEVVGSDGKHVGTVDKVRDDNVILTKKDQDAGGRHHSFPSAWIRSVDDKVTISRTADDAHAHWRDAERTPAFWGDEANRASGDAGQTARQGAQQTTQPGADAKPGQNG